MLKLYIKLNFILVNGFGFVSREKVIHNAKGKLVSDGTWTYKPPTIDTIPHKLNVKLNVELYEVLALKSESFLQKV